jgi:alpha-tubulin suppressor-like RCC1 family protein
MSRFIQIAVIGTTMGLAGPKHKLFALDEEGHIWEWDGERWRTLPLPNQETPT